MIASSPVAKGAALLAALALHAALLWDYSPNPTETQTEGASGARETRLGDSFEDMTTGVLAPMPAPRAEAVTPTTAQSVPTVAALPAQAPSVSEAQPAASQAVTQAVTQSPRPVQRPKVLEPKPKPAAVPKPKQKVMPKKGAQKESRKGVQNGAQKAAEAPKSTGTAKTKAAGNAAAQNYAGKVMRKISRVPKPRVASQGSATVRFTISAGGGLASVVIIKSSGSAALDRAALKVISRAAPFPKPPAGAERSFTLKIRGK